MKKLFFIMLMVLLPVIVSAQELKTFTIDPPKDYEPDVLVLMGAQAVRTNAENKVDSYMGYEPLDFSKYDEFLFKFKKEAKAKEINDKYSKHIGKYYSEGERVDILIVGGTELEKMKQFLKTVRELKHKYVKSLNNAKSINDIEAIVVSYETVTP